MAKPKTPPAPPARRSDGWSNIYTALGATDRDKRMGARFLSDRLDESTCEDLWRGDDICARIVETQPKAELRQGFEITISDAAPAKAPGPPERVDYLRVVQDAPDGNELAQELLAHFEDLNVTSTLITAREYARAYGGAALLVGADDGQTFDMPLNEGRIRSLKWLKVLRPRECWPSRYYRTQTHPKFGEVSHYRVQRETLGGGTSLMLEVHESRIIPFTGVVVSTRQRAQQRSWGDSVLVRCLAQVQDFQASFQAAGILLQDFAQGVFKMAGLAQALMQGDDDVAIARAKSIDLSRSVARAIIIDKDEDFERKATPVSGMPELLDRLCNRLAAAAKMPVTLLMGQAPAGLNATGASDVRAWYDEVSSDRELELRPRHNRLVRLIMLSADSPTKGIEPKRWKVKYPPLWQMTEQEQAVLRNQVGQTDVAYINAGVLLPEEVAVARYGGDEWSMEVQLDDAARAAAAEADAAAQEAQAELAKQAALNPPPPPPGGEAPPAEGEAPPAEGPPGKQAAGE